MRTPLFVAPLLSLALVACAATRDPPSASPRIAYLATRGSAIAYDQYHYAPVVRVGDLVIVSGIPAARGDDYTAKVRGMFENAKARLAEAGAELGDVVEIQTFHTGATSQPAFATEFEELAKVHAEYFRTSYPAWTAIGNAVLLAPGAVVEMRVVAIVGSGRAARVERSAAAH